MNYPQAFYHKAVTARGQGNRNFDKYRPDHVVVRKIGWRIRDQTMWVEFGSGHIYHAKGYHLTDYQSFIGAAHPEHFWTRHIRKLTQGTENFVRETVFASDCDCNWTNPYS